MIGLTREDTMFINLIKIITIAALSGCVHAASIVELEIDMVDQSGAFVNSEMSSNFDTNLLGISESGVVPVMQRSALGSEMQPLATLQATTRGLWNVERMVSKLLLAAKNLGAEAIIIVSQRQETLPLLECVGPTCYLPPLLTVKVLAVKNSGIKKTNQLKRAH